MIFPARFISTRSVVQMAILCIRMLRSLHEPPNAVQPSVQLCHGRTEGKPDEVRTRRMEEVPAVRWIDIKEDLRVTG